MEEKLTLKAVDFHEIIGNKEAITLAQGLQQNKVVELLNLYGKKIEKEGAIALARALQTNQTLRILCLSSNQIGNEGAIAFAQALHTNQTLEILNLSNNKIGENSERALTFSLFINKSLKFLILDYRKIEGTQFNHLETYDETILKKRKQYQKLLRLLNSTFLSDDLLSLTILIK